MPDIPGLDIDVHFGSTEEREVKWREDEALDAEEDPDDEELDETPADVIAMLGFDPKDIDDEEVESVTECSGPDCACPACVKKAVVSEALAQVWEAYP